VGIKPGLPLVFTDLNDKNEVVDDKFKNNFTKCHEIYNKDIGKMKSICKSIPKCEFIEATDIEDNAVGLCFAKDSDNRPQNLCLSISNLKDKSGAPVKDFEECATDSSHLNVEYLKNKNSSETNLDCSMFDSSDNMIDESFMKSTKPQSMNGHIVSNVNQKYMCENYKEADKSNKCEFVEYQKPIPNAHKSKYDKLTMCIPKGSIKLPNNLVKNKNQCIDGGIWSNENEICVNPRNDCNEFKHKKTCNMVNKCLWTSGSTDSNTNEPYTYGICKNMASSFNEVDDLIDNIHEKHVGSMIKVSNLEDQLENIVHNIRNKFTSF